MDAGGGKITYSVYLSNGPTLNVAVEDSLDNHGEGALYKTTDGDEGEDGHGVSANGTLNFSNTNDNNDNNNSIKNLQQIMHPQYHLKKEQQQNKNKTQTNEIITDRFIIYTQYGNNSIIIGDMNTGNIIRQCAIPNISYNCDLCIWNKLPPSLIPHNENIKVNEKALMLNSNNNMSY